MKIICLKEEIIIATEEIIEVSSFEMKKRCALYVFYKSYKNSRHLSRFGEVIFTSRKHNYSCLYVDESSLDEIISSLEKQNYVFKVQAGAMQKLSSNFASAFIETNKELKKITDFE